MDNPSAPAGEAPIAVAPQSTRGWINAEFSVPFSLKRLGLVLLSSYAPLLLFMLLHWEVVGVLAMLPGLWPYRFRFSPEREGLRVSWLLLTECIPWAGVEGAELSRDPRRFVPGRDGYFLRVARNDGRTLIIDAPRAELERLLNDVRAACSERSGNHSDDAARPLQPPSEADLTPDVSA